MSPGTQSGLHMPHRNLTVESGECGCGRCRGISVNEYQVGLGAVKDVAHAGEHTGCDIVQVLTLLHDVQVKVGSDIKYLEYLVKHLSVLSGNANNSFELVGVFLEFLDQWSHFYGFRSRSKHKHYSFHFCDLK